MSGTSNSRRRLVPLTAVIAVALTAAVGLAWPAGSESPTCPDTKAETTTTTIQPDTSNCVPPPSTRGDR